MRQAVGVLAFHAAITPRMRGLHPPIWQYSSSLFATLTFRLRLSSQLCARTKRTYGSSVPTHPLQRSCPSRTGRMRRFPCSLCVVSLP